MIFDTYNADDFTSSIKDGINLYKDNETWKKIVKNGMGKNFSWEKSAKEYIEKYENVLSID